MVLPLLTEERAEYLLANVPPYPLETPVLQMTLGEYFVATTEGFTERLLKEKRAYKAFGRLRQLKSELETLGKWLKRFDVPMSADEQAAAASVEFPSAEQRMVLDVIRWGLVVPREGEDILDAAERVKLSAWLLAHQEHVCNALFERNLSKIREKQSKVRRR